MDPHPYFMSQVPDTIRLTRLGIGPKGAGFLTRVYAPITSGRTPLFEMRGDVFNKVFLTVDEMVSIPLRS